MMLYASVCLLVRCVDILVLKLWVSVSWCLYHLRMWLYAEESSSMQLTFFVTDLGSSFWDVLGLRQTAGQKKSIKKRYLDQFKNRILDQFKNRNCGFPVFLCHFPSVVFLCSETVWIQGSRLCFCAQISSWWKWTRVRSSLPSSARTGWGCFWALSPGHAAGAISRPCRNSWGFTSRGRSWQANRFKLEANNYIVTI